MIPYPYNMVDMGGIDLAEANGTVVEGLYAKIVEAVNACGDVVLYNWKFASIEIAPQHTSILIGDPIIINGAVQVTEQDEVIVPGINPDPPVLVSLNATENGQYNPLDYDADGFDEVDVSVPIPLLTPLTVNVNGTFLPPSGYGGFDEVDVLVPIPLLTTLTVNENGTFLPPAGYGGFDEVNVSVSGGSSADVEAYLRQIAPTFAGGYEYANYIYDTEKVELWNLILLSDASQGAESVQLTESLNNFSGIILQGVYQQTRTSNYNTSILYLSPQLNTSYWAGMKDRNSAYTCNVIFTSDTEARLSGNRQVIIYGIP